MLTMTRRQLDRMAVFAAAGLPDEACGLIAGEVSGDEKIVREVYNVKNADASPEHFSMDPREQFRAICDMRRKGLVLIGNFHSHPSTPARPSAEDVRLAFDPSMSYMILSLKETELALKSFHIEDGLVYEEFLRIVESPPQHGGGLRMGGGGPLSFDFTIAHEIKSPLRTIDGYARIFLEDFGGALPPEARGLVENIRGICGETISMASKLLDYTRIVQNEPEMELVDLGALTNEVFHSLIESEEGRPPTRLAFAGPLPHVVGDRLLLHQAISNILSNSLKFTRHKGEALITAGHERKNGEELFFFRDNGAGFDMRYAKKLFEMFQRMHRADEFEGAGIGLVIVKKVIQMHKGRVWLTGEADKGATLYFTLPSDKVHSPAPPAERAASS